METSLLARLLGASRAVSPLAPINPVTMALPQLGLGQTVRAQVTARLTDGTFRVVVNDAPLKLLLPSGTKAGEIVTLRLVAREPQLEFEVDRPVESVQPRLSGAGRLIGQILREPAQSQSQQAQPVTTAPVIDAAKLKEPLARAIQRSGLFYESHQARWIDGEYPLSLLREEPQNVFAGLRQAIGMQSSASAQSAVNDLALHAEAGFIDSLEADVERQGDQGTNDRQELRSRTPQPEAEARLREKNVAPAVMRGETSTARETNSRDATADAMRASSIGPSPFADADEAPQASVARELLPIVRQQLEAIETRQIVWQGELWPGQPIRWQIADRETDPQHPAAGREWLTRFVLRLPTLGEIGADLAVGARGVRIIVTAKDSVAADALRSATPELAQALEAQGLRVGALEVRHHE